MSAASWGAGVRPLSSSLSRTVSKTSRIIAQMRGAGGGDLMELHCPYQELGLRSLSPSPQATLTHHFATGSQAPCQPEAL